MNKETIEQEVKLFLQANKVRCVKCKHEYSVHTDTGTKCISCRCRSFRCDPNKLSKELAEYFQNLRDDLDDPSEHILQVFVKTIETLSGLEMKHIMSMSAQEVAKKSENYQRRLLLSMMDGHVDMASQALSYLYHLMRQFIELTEAERTARRKKAELLSR